MTAQEMLRKLGYSTDKSGISTFQRDYNRLGTGALRVTGELNKETTKAIEFAHASRVVFTTIRDRQGV